MTERPAYSSYLPAAYLDEPDGLLARLVEMFETLMAGRDEEPVRALESRVRIDALDSGVRAAIDASAVGARYDDASRQLVFVGEMSAADRAALEAIVTAAALSAADQARHLDAIGALHSRSQGRDEAVPGLERLLDGIAHLSDPIRAPGAGRDPDEGETGYFDDDFVPYLARWVALTLRHRWPDTKRRRLIRMIVPLYKKRGTLDGIRQVLELFVEWPVEIGEELGLVVGERSTVAEDTTVGGLPHFFRVDIPYGHREPGAPPEPFDLSLLRSLVGFTRDVVELEKPAHTDYAARIDVPGFVIGEYSTVERDTLIGGRRPIVVLGSEPTG